jgi:2'-5' RNA ligase
LVKIGIVPTRENFVPHITLGRIRKPIQKQFFQNTINQWDNVFLGNSKIDSIVLFESILRSSGAVHKPLKIIKLKHE